MALTYSAFKTYIQAALWRANDAVLSTNLDTLIRKADNELDKRTKHWERRRKTVVIQPSSQDYNLSYFADDFQAIVSLTNNQTSFYRDTGPEFESVTLNKIYEERAVNSGTLRPFYAADRNDGDWMLRMIAPFSSTDRGNLTMVYRISIPDYEDCDKSWMEDEYLDLYEYTILKHCALFLREDDRITLYKGLADDAFAMADEDNAHNLTHGGTPMRMRPHRYVP
ncbi:MAG: hypothetical protein QNJ16_20675 [Rhodobacter sp.]|nr:hypothetical protein [Rhodobacter sp.]